MPDHDTIATNLAQLIAETTPPIAWVLQSFAFAQLPPHLRNVSAPFANLACIVASSSSNPETTVALRKLLEAKDCAVRAVLFDPS